MKVKVVYRKTVEETIEVDDKFYALSYEGGYDNLPDKEADDLFNEILTEVNYNTGADHHDLYGIYADDGEVLFEG